MTDGRPGGDITPVHVHTFADADGVQRAHCPAELCDYCRSARCSRGLHGYDCDHETADQSRGVTAQLPEL